MTDTAASNPHVYLPGLILSGYRSFGPELQIMGPFSQINVFAGPNNAGKSNILKFISEHLTPLFFNRQGESKFACDQDDHRYSRCPLVIGMPLKTDAETLKAAFPEASGAQCGAIQTVLDSELLRLGTSLSWAVTARNMRTTRDIKWLELEPFKTHLISLRNSDTPLRNPYLKWSQRGYRLRQIDNVTEAIELTLTDLRSHTPPLPTIRYIPAFRQIDTDDEKGKIDLKHYSADGKNIAVVYALLDGAEGANYRPSQEKVRLIHKFLRDVTGEQDMVLRVPRDKDYFEVLRGGEPESMTCLGSGIQHIIMIAIAVTLCHNEIVCLEEPEAYLHPILQRKLIEYLKNHTSNQYFISTHSAQFLDVPGVEVFQLEMIDHATKVNRAITSSDRFAICRILGYRASDIVQANCVVWVEGPSDLLYIRKWIAAVDDKLREGIEYSVMYYGGSLRSWLTSEEAGHVEELVSLVAINRHCAFLMDSDKGTATSKLNKNKLRVEDSVKSHGGFVWVSQGREIENYIPHELRKRCVKAVAPAHESKVKSAWPYGYALPEQKGKGALVDKVEFARAVCREPVVWGGTDLKLRVAELVNFIRRSNRMDELPLPETRKKAAVKTAEGHVN